MTRPRETLPTGQERSCKCGQTVEVPVTVSMRETDERVREWMREHAKGCPDMRAEIAAQGGTYLSR